ncbi:MAG TPA: hypothetical protein VKA34_16180 [Balneolales bacterium]|nr:hypothetical protein [Balneolales bacterium]
MQIFYAILGLVWIVAAIYLYLYDPSNKIILPIIYFLVGLAIGSLAYYYPRLFLGRYIKISDAGIYGLLSSQKEVKVAWADIKYIDVRDKALDIQTRKEGTIQFSINEMYDVEWKNLRKTLNKVINEKNLLRD